MSLQIIREDVTHRAWAIQAYEFKLFGETCPGFNSSNLAYQDFAVDTAQDSLERRRADGVLGGCFTPNFENPSQKTWGITTYVLGIFTRTMPGFSPENGEHITFALDQVEAALISGQGLHLVVQSPAVAPQLPAPAQDDPGKAARINRPDDMKKMDNAVGRFTLRHSSHLLLSDIAAISDLLQHITKHTSLNQDQFLKLVLEDGDWNTAIRVSTEPIMAPQTATDLSNPIGTWAEDCYSLNDKAKQRKTPSLQLKPLSQHLRKGANAYLMLHRNSLAPKWEVVAHKGSYGNLDNVVFTEGVDVAQVMAEGLHRLDTSDISACKRYNEDMLVYLVRKRLHHWYTKGPALKHEQTPQYCKIPGENEFVPEIPQQGAKVMFAILSRYCRLTGCQLEDLECDNIQRILVDQLTSRRRAANSAAF